MVGFMPVYGQPTEQSTTRKFLTVTNGTQSITVSDLLDIWHVSTKHGDLRDWFIRNPYNRRIAQLFRACYDSKLVE